jgi:hypothetical protein
MAGAKYYNQFTKYSQANSGQKEFAGWSVDGLKRYQTYKKLVTRERLMKEDWKLDAKTQLRDYNRKEQELLDKLVSEFAPDEKSSQKKRQRKALVEQPIEVKEIIESDDEEFDLDEFSESEDDDDDSDLGDNSNNNLNDDDDEQEEGADDSNNKLNDGDDDEQEEGADDSDDGHNNRAATAGGDNNTGEEDEEDQLTEKEQAAMRRRETKTLAQLGTDASPCGNK